MAREATLLLESNTGLAKDPYKFCRVYSFEDSESLCKALDEGLQHLFSHTTAWSAKRAYCMDYCEKATYILTGYLASKGTECGLHETFFTMKGVRDFKLSLQWLNVSGEKLVVVHGSTPHSLPIGPVRSSPQFRHEKSAGAYSSKGESLNSSSVIAVAQGAMYGQKYNLSSYNKLIEFLDLNSGDPQQKSQKSRLLELKSAIERIEESVNKTLLAEGQTVLADMLNEAGIPEDAIEQLLDMSKNGVAFADYNITFWTFNGSAYYLQFPIFIHGVSFGNIVAIDPDLKSAVVQANIRKELRDTKGRETELNFEERFFLLNPAGLFELKSFISTMHGSERYFITSSLVDLVKSVHSPQDYTCSRSELSKVAKSVFEQAFKNRFVIRAVYGYLGIYDNEWSNRIGERIKKTYAAKELAKLGKTLAGQQVRRSGI